jgi:hypothetical protein
MDHLLSRPGVVSATNKDSITVSRCSAFCEMMKFNMGSWTIALVLGGLAYAVALEGLDWKVDDLPESTDDWLQVAMFSGPTILLSLFAFVVPIILNPYILGWPFYRRNKKATKKQELVKKITPKEHPLGPYMVDVAIGTYIDKANALDKEIERMQGKDNVELGSLLTHELHSSVSPKKQIAKQINAMYARFERRASRASVATNSILVGPLGPLVEENPGQSSQSSLSSQSDECSV